jgi:hypothetical protein
MAKESMLDKFRRLLGVKEIPEEVTPLYRGARNEREALALLREARRRDEQRRRRAMQHLEVFGSGGVSPRGGQGRGEREPPPHAARRSRRSAPRSKS